MEDSNLVGLLRSLQGEIWILCGGIVVIIVALLLTLRLINNYEEDGGDRARASNARAFTWGAAGVLTAIGIGLFVWHAVMVASVNRMPRSDIEKSSVYEQMDEHLNPKNDLIR